MVMIGRRLPRRRLVQCAPWHCYSRHGFNSRQTPGSYPHASSSCGNSNSVTDPAIFPLWQVCSANMPRRTLEIEAARSHHIGRFLSEHRPHENLLVNFTRRRRRAVRGLWAADG